MSNLAKTLSATAIPSLTEGIARKAGLYRRDYRSTLGCGLADCMIAAPSSHHGIVMATLNARHFKILEHVITPYEKV